MRGDASLRAELDALRGDLHKPPGGKRAPAATEPAQQEAADRATTGPGGKSELEEQLSDRCEAAGLKDKAAVHLFSAASCWALAGNFYQSIAWCKQILSRPDLTPAFRKRVEAYAKSLSERRAKWYTELAVLEANS